MLLHSDYGNSRKKYLLEHLQQESHNLLCYSKNLLMTEAKYGYTDEWCNTNEKVNLLKQMLAELPDSHGISVYVGRVYKFIPLADQTLIMLELVGPEKFLTFQSIKHLFLLSESCCAWVDTYNEMLKEQEKQDNPAVVKVKVKQSLVFSIEWVENWEEVE